MASAPPLRIWLYSTFLAAGVVALLALLHWSPWRTPDTSIAAYTQQYLGTSMGSRELRVLGLGSSLLWAATPPASFAAPQGVHWMRMTKPGPGIGYLQPSLEAIARNPPDVLVIETNLLALDSDDMKMTALRQDFSFAMRGLAYTLTGQAWFAPQQTYTELLDQKQFFPCTSIPAHLLQRQLLTHADEVKAWFSDTTIDLELSSKLGRLSQRGVHIVLLELRRSPTMEKIIAPEKQRWLKRLQLVLPPGPKISYLMSPNLQRQDSHCDGSHMNETGARLFAPWWNAQLLQMRERR